MSDYLADDVPIGAGRFVAAACDPRASVVVEACAGSGKTWLLVGRIVRLLLDGAAPGEILAITFTRRAAQEMRERLLRDLEALAAATPDEVVALLVARGLEPAQARAASGRARQLYERVVTAPVPVTIDTFHGWFWHLLSRAPLGAGVPYAPTLLESTDRVRADAWLHFGARLLQPRHAAARAAWEQLLTLVDEQTARRLLREVLERRAEWWSFAAGDEPAAVERALAPLRAASAADPCAALDAHGEFSAVLRSLRDCWRAAQPAVKAALAAADAADAWFATRHRDAAARYRAVCGVLLTTSLAPRQALLPEKLAARLPAASAALYAAAHAQALGRLADVEARRPGWRARQLNEAVLGCAPLFLDAYREQKEQQQALDFTDLEWHAHRLLADPDHAAYLQARLDARYRHLLLDEFQDTNPLQWQVLQSWLAAYGAPDESTAGPGGGGDGRPTVFVVGDPKQSIYRFRRADPRVFEAAATLLRTQYGATRLRTNVTRRNARTIIDALNAVLDGRHPLYQAQHTLATATGAFVLLPLAEPAADPPLPTAPRDVLRERRVERDRDTRYREGRVVANEVAHWRGQVRVPSTDGSSRPARWSDVLLLVRTRTHLADYERALRDAGIPFVSDRRGGLLDTLEAADLTALLDFLTGPAGDLALAHALRAPLFGCSDADLIALAGAAGDSWWQRLQALAEPSPALARARVLLGQWLGLAGVLPVHDLLDRIFFEARVRERYAAVVPAALLAQVQANLDAFLELALALDAGRYPSLPRFIDELAALRRHAEDEAPDEGAVEAGDAVRVMTIHGAKGLEAEIVVIADTHAAPPPARESVLVVWPPDAAAPVHVSVVGRGAAGRDAARAAWLAAEAEQDAQEDWNLLYVAATRARQVLLVSGSLPRRQGPSDSWYRRLEAAQGLSPGAAPPVGVAPVAAAERSVCDFLPAPLPTGTRLSTAPESDAQRLGRLWHALLEHGPQADAMALARGFGVGPQQAAQARDAAARVRERLPQFFSNGAAELELVDMDGALLRIDRLVEHEDALWILDFKWRVTAAERERYAAQVRGYGAALRAVRTDKPVRLALVDSDGVLHPVPDGAVPAA